MSRCLGTRLRTRARHDHAITRLDLVGTAYNSLLDPISVSIFVVKVIDVLRLSDVTFLIHDLSVIEILVVNKLREVARKIINSSYFLVGSTK